MTTGVAHLATWGICGLAAAGALVRPFRTPEAIWAASAVGKGTDVYLFLIGMMLLSEVFLG